MEIWFNVVIFLLLAFGFWKLTEWLWEVGVSEIMIYTEGFLIQETKKLRIKVLPEITSTKWLDRLELLLYYSGIRNSIPFVSAKVWILFQILVYNCSFVLAVLLTGSLWKAGVCCIMIGGLTVWFLTWMRQHNMKATEKQLLELLNITESFAVTGDEPLTILTHCSNYMTGPVGHALSRIETYLQQGWSARMILEKLKISLEHPKWQEFIHNLNVCCMYNSDFNYVFRSSRKSIQAYLSSKKERQSIKRTAQVEMGMIVGLSMLIMIFLAKFLNVSMAEVFWGNVFAKCCSVYMLAIIGVFFWKLGAYEKE